MISSPTIRFYNEGAMVARCTVSSNVNGQPQSASSGDYTIGTQGSFSLSAADTEMRVVCETNSGSGWNTVFDQTYPATSLTIVTIDHNQSISVQQS